MDTTKLDLTTEQGVVALMRSAQSEQDWNNKADEVKAANGHDYPRFWYAAVMLSGVAGDARSRWNRRN